MLQLPPSKMAEVARFCNAFPNVEIAFELQEPDEIVTGDAVTLLVQLEREGDAADGDTPSAAVHAPSFPRKKAEGWWLVVGDMDTNTLVSIRRVSLRYKANIKLDFVAPEEPGEYKYSLFFMCDSYMGCDQELEVKFKVAQGESDDEESEDE